MNIKEENLKILIKDLGADSPLVKMYSEKIEKEKLNPVKKSNLIKIRVSLL